MNHLGAHWPRLMFVIRQPDGLRHVFCVFLLHHDARLSEGWHLCLLANLLVGEPRVLSLMVLLMLLKVSNDVCKELFQIRL